MCRLWPSKEARPGLEKLEGEGGSLQPVVVGEVKKGERGGERGRGHSTEG